MGEIQPGGWSGVRRRLRKEGSMKLDQVDLNNLDTFEAGTPHDQFKILRNEDPVHRHKGLPGQEDFWCITKHADLKRISKEQVVEQHG
jgi:hypothetical protein